MKILDVPQSGSLAGITSSRNRYGQYRRSRSTPVNPNTSWQSTVRGNLQLNAAAWRALTAGQRTGWESLGSQMSRTDALGQSYTLNGFQAYCSVNGNRLNAGDAAVSAAPSLVTPDPLTFGTITLTTAVFTVAYTATPCAAGDRVFAYCSPQRSAGRSFEGDLRLIHVSAAAGASPADVFTEFEARMGTPTEGDRVFLSIAQYSLGFLSVPAVTSQIVVAA